MKLSLPLVFSDIFHQLKQHGLSCYLTGSNLLRAAYGMPVKPPFQIITASPIDSVKKALSQQDYCFIADNKRSPMQADALDFLYVSDIESYLQHQPFGVLGLAVDISGEILSSKQCLTDLEQNTIRCQIDPQTCLELHPLSKLTSLRLVAQFENLSLDESLYEAIRKNPSLSGCAKADIAWEINQLLVGNNASAALMLMAQLHLLDEIFPDLAACVGITQNEYHSKDVYGHTVDVVDQMPQEHLALRMAALFHDVCKPQCKQILDGKIRFPRHALFSADLCAKTLHEYGYAGAFSDKVHQLIRYHMKKQILSDDELIAILHTCGPQTAREIFLLQLGDNATTTYAYREGMYHNQQRTNELIAKMYPQSLPDNKK